jgi:hypothetical protein
MSAKKQISGKGLDVPADSAAEFGSSALLSALPSGLKTRHAKLMVRFFAPASGINVAGIAYSQVLPGI